MIDFFPICHGIIATVLAIGADSTTKTILKQIVALIRILIVLKISD